MCCARSLKVEPERVLLQIGQVRWWFAWLLVFAFGCAPTSRFVREVPWAGQGTWLAVDTHIHSKWSDGAYTPAELTALAGKCDAIALTDHVHPTFEKKHYARTLSAISRSTAPIVLTGGEWNVPPHRGDVHATVLFKNEDLSKWQTFFWGYDDRATRPVNLDTAMRSWPKLDALIFINHPGRKDFEGLVSLYSDLRHLGAPVLGFSGAPGHQNSDQYRTVDRWDPAVLPDGAWDKLLREGFDVWAARAPSDFHNDDPNDLNDPHPCKFSRTWVYAPQRSREGVWQALKAGTFFGVHGDIARKVELTVDAPNLPRPAMVGERIETGSNHVEVQLDLQSSKELYALELIIVDTTTKVIPLKPGRKSSIKLLGNDVVFRARGRHKVPNGPDLMFYTNPIRVLRR